jgi:formamidopyrimidine-DNA glycosylase
MPELPEVETIARGLNEAVVGKVIDSVEVLRERCFEGRSDELVGKSFKKVGRVSKLLVFEVKGIEKVILVHLKMTGQLVYLGKKGRVAGGHPSKDWVGNLPSSHTRVIISFKDGSKLFFNDMRSFGWMKLISVDSWKALKKTMPPDVVDKEFTLCLFKEAISSSKRAVKLILLDQKKMGGVGNIYANDALFLAKVDPRKSGMEISVEESGRLFKAVVQVVKEGIKYGGTTLGDGIYVDASGIDGNYQERFLVYSRDGEKCKNCEKKIEKYKLGGRGTFWCPNCQMR